MSLSLISVAKYFLSKKKAICYKKKKIVDFSATQFKGEHPPIFAKTLQIFATVQTLSKSPSVEKICTHITDLNQYKNMQEPESPYLTEIFLL